MAGNLFLYAAKISASQSLCGNGSFLISMMTGICITLLKNLYYCLIIRRYFAWNPTQWIQSISYSTSRSWVHWSYIVLRSYCYWQRCNRYFSLQMPSFYLFTFLCAGVGAFYDDAANKIFNGNSKTLYHFAVGQPTPDHRISIPMTQLVKKSIYATFAHVSPKWFVESIYCLFYFFIIMAILVSFIPLKTCTPCVFQVQRNPVLL